MSAVQWVVFTVLCLSLCRAEEEKSNLLFVQMLFRHGDRTPILKYPDDPNPPETWPEGYGKLTQLGKKQQLVLGKFLRSYYSDFVTSNPNEVRAMSSDYDRCRKSALSFLASVYAPSPEWTVDGQLDWQPIPVDYSPLNTDRYLSLESECPQFYEEQFRRYNSLEFLASTAKYQPLFEILQLHGAISYWPSAMLFHDTLAIEKANGLPVPSWIEPYFDELAEFSEFIFNFNFDSRIQQRLRMGTLLGKIVENMDEKIAGNISNQKVQIFSAHDASIAGILQALNIYNNIRPPYSSTLIFELHDRPSTLSKEVRLLYLNSTRPEDVTSHVPHVLQLEGCTEFCPLENFRAMVAPLVPDDLDVECRPSDSANQELDDAIGVMLGLRREEATTHNNCCGCEQSNGPN